MIKKFLHTVKNKRVLWILPFLFISILTLPILQQTAAGLSVSDNFNRASTGLGGNWATVNGTNAPKIVSNKMQAGTANTVNSAYWKANTFGSNQFAQANLPNSSGSQYGPGIAVRLSNTKGYFLWYGNSPNTVSIWRMDSSTSWTQLNQSGSLSVSLTDVWKITAVGSTITGYQNGNQVVQTSDTHYTAGSPGVWLYYSANQIDNWSGGDVSAPTTYSIGGNVSGLSGSVVLQNNGGNDLTVSANGAFAFTTRLTPGSAYKVTVKTNPAGQSCTVANGSGTVGTSNVTNVTISCMTNVTPTYSIGGNVSGLTGTVALQNNGGDDLSVNANGSYTFSTRLNSGSAYNVTVKTNPDGQTCTVENGTGSVSAADVTNVAVSCTTNSSGSASDDFNRANGALGGNWTDMTEGGLTITSQAVAGSTTGVTGDIRTAETYNGDQYSTVQVTTTQLTAGQWIGPSVRSQNGGLNDYLGIYYWNNGNPDLMLFKRISGNWTQLGSTYNSGALPAGTSLELMVSGTTISFLQDGVSRITAADGSITGGAPGIMSFGTGQVDNWSGGNVVSGPSYTIGGTVTGLTGTVVLENNGANDLSVGANGAFTFSSPVASGLPYSVTVKANPSGQTCNVANGTGTVGSANVTNVAVSCAANGIGSGTDDFNRSNGSLGSNWTDEFDGGLVINSGAVAGTSAGSTTGDIRTAETYNSNQYSEVQVSSTQLTGGQWIGPSVRAQNSGQNGYVGIYYWNNGNPELMLFKRTGVNSWTQIGNTYNCGPLTAGTKLRLMVVGGSLSFLENGVERIAGYDNSYSGGAPGIMSFGTGQVDNWAGGTAGFEVHYLSTDTNGVETYDVISANNGYGPQLLRVLRPTNPAQGVAHNFAYALPVEPGEGNTYGDGVQTLQSLNAQNQYNLTIIEPSFAIDPWYADNPNDTNLRYETFMTSELQPWVNANLATSGTEQHWLIGFSKSGIGGQDLLLKHPDLFTLAASWDFPADMSSYNQFGASSSNQYGTDANFQANYRLTNAFLNAHKAPFISNNRIWVGGYNLFQTDVSDYNALLSSNGIIHSTETPTSMAHRWDSGWVQLALAALYQDSLTQH